ncbi:MAG: hypothetical protein ED555_07960 [Allomuricauda sp.]|nr:MAG: hypothetical protein ED555_07960 [Allomuricauda sp.]
MPEVKEPIENTIAQVQIGTESFFKIADSDLMRPFFMSIVSDSNHWMFISSNGGLTAGRKNAQFSFFPYYTDDKITESADITGSKTILRIKEGEKELLWEPFSNRDEGRYTTSRNLYKNAIGNKVLFEEINEDLQLTFRYQWSSSNLFGFVREAQLINNATTSREIHIVDGIQNIVPYGVGSDTQNRASNLVDAYKRSELVPEVGVSIFALSAIIVDKAEPSEALKANIAWSLGMENSKHLVSSLQLDNFRKGLSLHQETDVKGEKGAYFLCDSFTMAANSDRQWMIIANVNQNHAGIVSLCESLKGDRSAIRQQVLNDVEAGSERLIGLNASADGLQCTADSLRDTRHFSNTLFNIMRGGIFDFNYQIEKHDFNNYLSKANRKVVERNKTVLDKMPDVFTLQELTAWANEVEDADFERLSKEYLPLKFSRRHGDPSRPWNIFSINTNSEVDGSKILDYQGNWRDIFQNWEALAYAFPEFIDGMIFKFFNASTFDGYNPYRVTKDGFDWEVIEPDDPWSYIGYWGDHQIIYSLKFLEFINKHHPGKLEGYFEKETFVYANVPYKIKSYEKLLDNPKDTIDFDHDADLKIRHERTQLGADAALLKGKSGAIHSVNFIEKMLASVLAKVSNFIPEGGIWLNTQRPEWNDANNALVGNGVSMVTLYYLRRYLKFFEELLGSKEDLPISISTELNDLFQTIQQTLLTHSDGLKEQFSDKQRKVILDGMGYAASDFREKIYKHSFSGEKQEVTLHELKKFCTLGLKYLEHSIAANKRPDNLYHAYNLMSTDGDGVAIDYLNEMLEGQVAVLSSGYLTAKEALAVLDGLKASAMFRKDQYSYMLYPNKQLPGFLEKNTIPASLVAESILLSTLIDAGNTQIIEKDVQGEFHFNGNFKNANDVADALVDLHANGIGVSDDEKEKVLAIFEQVFDHKSFTGRSGTFFGYEGLGSIYWHMVSKLLLATQECCLQAIEAKADAETVGRLLEHYYEINAGIGVHKSPQLYGAFPTDPYSHTPGGKGAQQPGMTGQVKEDVLSRFGELGVLVKDGQLCFQPVLLRKSEFLKESKVFKLVDVQGKQKEMTLPVDSLGFTYCQVPVVYEIAGQNGIRVIHSNGTKKEINSLCLDHEISQSIFRRTGEVQQVHVQLTADQLR